MISAMEIEQLEALRDGLVEDSDSDKIRLGRALGALLEAHEELKKPHVQALAEPKLQLDYQRVLELKSLAGSLSASAVSAGRKDIPDETHKEALMASVRTASAEIIRIVESES
jgi:hypothetical protein